MIIGEALKRLFKDLDYEYTNSKNETTTRKIQFHYGDHKELIKWTALKTKNNAAKYPLVWYVVAPYVEDSQDFKCVETNLIILHTFRDRKDNLNDVISGLTYDGVIEPVWQKVKALLNSNPGALQVLGDRNRKYTIKDEANYGVTTEGVRTSQNDFISKKTKGDQSITLDIVDGRIIKLKLRIKTNCI